MYLYLLKLLDAQDNMLQSKIVDKLIYNLKKVWNKFMDSDF